MEYSLFFNAATRCKQTTPTIQLGEHFITAVMYGAMVAIAILAYLS
jgi:hypothetical protein